MKQFSTVHITVEEGIPQIIKSTKENMYLQESLVETLFFSYTLSKNLFYEDESAEENEIALYNALHEEALPEGTEIKKIKIDNVLYMNFQNDVSFGVGGKVLVFGEHQSTINRNMPLRCLMYIGRAYERIVPVRDRYKKNMVELPKPEFYTFYNGKEKWAREEVLRLSDAYKVKDENPMLDLEVKVININPDEHHEVLDKCQVLKEYGQFIDVVNKYQEQEVPEPYKCAIEECIEKGILADYLKRKGNEVVNMLIAEYDYDMDIEVQREEAYEDGEKAGIAIGEERTKHIFQLDRQGKSVEEIAEVCGVSVEKVKEVLE